MITLRLVVQENQRRFTMDSTKTTEETKAAYEEGYIAGLEAAAQIASNDDTDCEHSQDHCGCSAGYYIAECIRALKD